MRRIALVAGLVLFPASLPAQDSTVTDTVLRRERPPVRDTAPPVRPAADPVADSMPPHHLAAFLHEAAPGPLPGGSRWIFTRDSLLWSSAYTVADLLAEVPGVFTARTGFVHAAAAVGAGGRGTDAIELYWDGVPWQPVGRDSLGPDLSAISLFTLRRVEVHVLPALLRVYLISERHQKAHTRSVVRIVSGALGTGGYAALFQQNWNRGLGLQIAGDALRHDRNPEVAAGIDRRVDVWGRLDWNPNPNLSASWQLRQSELTRDPQSAGPITAGRRLGSRTDALLTMRASTEAAGYGWYMGGAWRSSGHDDSLFGGRVMRELMVDVGHRGLRQELHLRGGVGDGAVRRRLTLDAGAAPLAPITLHGGATWTRDGFDRDSWRMWGTAALELGRFALSGEAVRRREVALPLVETDTIQRATDLAVRLGFGGRVLAGRIGVERRDAWSPGPVPVLDELPLATTERSTWAVAWLRLGPVRSFSITGWFADARGLESPDLQPPTHARVQVTYRNRFFPTFRSGAFDLKIQFAFESWGEGVAGRQPGGVPIVLPGQSFQEWFVQFQLAGFRAFYLLRNARNTREGYLPDFQQPTNAQTFGVKWEFSS